jgi:hypothetical protein
VLINISNDGYLGPTAVMRQHLANAVFRAVENGRPLLRVTNTGITAFITQYGEVREPTKGFVTEVRMWGIARAQTPATFYAKHGDVFAIFCVVLSLVIFVGSFWKSPEILLGPRASRPPQATGSLHSMISGIPRKAGETPAVPIEASSLQSKLKS